MLYFFFKGLKGRRNESITIHNKQGEWELEGKPAKRVGLYFIIIAIIITLFILNQFIFRFSVSFNPFEVYMFDECIISCF